jgi:hypothetical protein
VRSTPAWKLFMKKRKKSFPRIIGRLLCLVRRHGRQPYQLHSESGMASFLGTYVPLCMYVLDKKVSTGKKKNIKF